jgi:hypothetical protein
MATPYDGKIYLVEVKGQFLARKSLGDVSRLLTDSMPNADGIFLQVCQGQDWQGKFDNDPKEVNGPADVAQWVSALASRGLETHVWGIPHGTAPAAEAGIFIQAAKVAGVRSLGLDVEHGDAYFRGSADGARQFMQLLRDGLGWDFHIALILDPRRNRPFNVFVDPFVPFVNSLHPMVYPKDFNQPVQSVLDSAFDLLSPYAKPIVPMLQAYNQIPPADITQQGNYSFQKGAASISYFCLGDRNMGAAEYEAVAAVRSPVIEDRQKTALDVVKLPPGAAGLWPDDARGYTENVYERSAARPWHDFRDIYGHVARWKLTSATNDVAVSYSPLLPAPGRYSVEVFIPKDNADSRRADYHVNYYEGGQQRDRQVKIDQSSRSDEWVPLGVFDLDPRRPADGRVNITDFSDEQPPQAVAFAGVRWVPVPAGQPAVSQPSSQTQILAQQGPGGGSKPAPAAQPTAPGPATTNQDVINAFIVAAAQFGDSWQNLISAAGLNSIYNNRKAAYAGPAIAVLPQVGTDRKAAIVEALKLPAADLASAAVKAGKPAAPTTQASPSAPGQGQVDGRTWGVHGSAGSAAPPRQMWDFWIKELTDMGIRWYKQCDSTGPGDTGEGSIFRWVLYLRDHGIKPVVRYQMGHQFPNRLDGDLFNKMAIYAKEGVVWAEIGNEPNLDIEWSSPSNFVTWQNADCIRTLAEIWLNDAEESLRRGARPAFYAMAPVDWGDGRPHPQFSGTKFHERVWQYIGADPGRRERARTIFQMGGWVAVHAAVYEFPVDFDPFPEGRGWDQCLRSYEIPLKYIQQNLGLNGGVDFVVMSTESGVFTPESHSMGGHKRYESDDAHAQLTVQMFDYLEKANVLQAMMPWTLAVCDEIGLNNRDFPGDGWYYNSGGLKSRSVVARLKSVHSQRS